MTAVINRVVHSSPRQQARKGQIGSAPPTARSSSGTVARPDRAGASQIVRRNRGSSGTLTGDTTGHASMSGGSPMRRTIGLEECRTMIRGIFRGTLHESRVGSLSGCLLGVIHAPCLAIHAIGRAYACETGKIAKHGIKQVDRYLSNSGMDMNEMLHTYMQHVAGDRSELMLTMDWTDFDKDNQTTLTANVVTNHGRATPFTWCTYYKSELKHQTKEYEMAGDQSHQSGLVARYARDTARRPRVCGLQVLRVSQVPGMGLCGALSPGHLGDEQRGHHSACSRLDEAVWAGKFVAERGSNGGKVRGSNGSACTEEENEGGMVSGHIAFGRACCVDCRENTGVGSR